MSCPSIRLAIDLEKKSLCRFTDDAVILFGSTLVDCGNVGLPHPLQSESFSNHGVTTILSIKRAPIKFVVRRHIEESKRNEDSPQRSGPTGIEKARKSSRSDTNRGVTIRRANKSSTGRCDRFGVAVTHPDACALSEAFRLPNDASIGSCEFRLPRSNSVTRSELI